MRNWTINIVIKHFDEFIKDIDFANLPEKDSEEYRQLVLQTANDVIFVEGRYTLTTEWILEMFDEPEVCALVENLSVINRLSDAKRMRLAFYLDLKEVCYPLFRGQKVDWSAWPWCMQDGASSFDNQELWRLLTKVEKTTYRPLPNLMAAIIYDLNQQIWKDEEEIYSCVASQDASDTFYRLVNELWEKANKTEEDEKALIAAISECADDLWAIENHTRVGQLLGFDQLTQSIYDSFDTFIDSTYRHKQVLCARELAAWIREHWTIGEEHPAQEKVDALYYQWIGLMAEYGVTTPDENYSWNILMLDVLGTSAVPKEEEVWE